MQTIDSLADNLHGYLNQEQVNQVCRAYYYAEQAHDGHETLTYAVKKSEYITYA